jgi:GNAT superfamily N-acetyltransferase
MTDFVLRPATPDDSKAVFEVFLESILDLGKRLGASAISGGDDPGSVAALWEQRQSLFAHLAAHHHRFVLALDGARPVGYARSIVRDGTWQLTELFVTPDRQSGGLGKDLLRSVAPAEPVDRRVVVATLDQRALVRYLRCGVAGRFPIAYFERTPEAQDDDQGLVVEPLVDAPAVHACLDSIDREVLGYARTIDHKWLMKERRGFLYRYRGESFGYGYVGYRSGPAAVRDPAVWPALLAHLESVAAKNPDGDGATGGPNKFGLDVPLINHTAVEYLLDRGYSMSAFYTLFMSDVPFGRYDRYVFTTPTFFS